MIIFWSRSWKSPQLNLFPAANYNCRRWLTALVLWFTCPSPSSSPFFSPQFSTFRSSFLESAPTLGSVRRCALHLSMAVVSRIKNRNHTSELHFTSHIRGMFSSPFQEKDHRAAPTRWTSFHRFDKLSKDFLIVLHGTFGKVILSQWCQST